MKVFVIGLPSEQDRILSISASLENALVNFSLIEGVVVEGDMVAPAEYNSECRMKKYGFEMSNPEIGCFLAHRKCWKEVSTAEEPCLILESDMVLSDNVDLCQTLEAIKGCSTSFDLVRLHGIFPRNEVFFRKIVSTGGKFQIGQTWGDPMGAGAYIIRPESARKLLDLSRRFSVPVDVFLSQYWKHFLRFRTLKPYVFANGDFSSSIGDRRRPKQSVFERLRIEMNRARDDILRLLLLPWNFFR